MYGRRDSAADAQQAARRERHEKHGVTLTSSTAPTRLPQPRAQAGQLREPVSELRAVVTLCYAGHLPEGVSGAEALHRRLGKFRPRPGKRSSGPVWPRKGSVGPNPRPAHPRRRCRRLPGSEEGLLVARGSGRSGRGANADRFVGIHPPAPGGPYGGLSVGRRTWSGTATCSAHWAPSTAATGSAPSPRTTVQRRVQCALEPSEDGRYMCATRPAGRPPRGAARHRPDQPRLPFHYLLRTGHGSRLGMVEGGHPGEVLPHPRDQTTGAGTTCVDDQHSGAIYTWRIPEPCSHTYIWSPYRCTCSLQHMGRHTQASHLKAATQGHGPHWKSIDPASAVSQQRYWHMVQKLRRAALVEQGRLNSSNCLPPDAAAGA